jgi:hypothetical protein
MIDGDDRTTGFEGVRKRRAIDKGMIGLDIEGSVGITLSVRVSSLTLALAQ